MSDIRIEARVVIQEVLNERVCRAALPNGKIITAYARKADPVTPMNSGDERTVLMSLCNFSEGRLMPQPSRA
ncbi:MAG: hypothetical protein WCO71_12520 [Pseudomonadota bacterium]